MTRRAQVDPALGRTPDVSASPATAAKAQRGVVLVEVARLEDEAR